MNYQIGRNNSIIGTYSHLEVMKGLADGTFLPTDFYWRSGMSGWKTLGEFNFNEQSQSGPSSPPPRTASARNLKFAGFWVRAGAVFLDGLIGFMVGMVLVVFMGLFGIIVNEGLFNVFSLIYGWLYKALLESSSSQATFGKQAMGLIVTTENGERISFAQATGRHFGGILSALTLCIGFAMAGWTQRKQTLHDIMAGTLVCYKK